MLSDAFTSPWSAEVLITGNTKLPLFDDSDDGLDLIYCSNRLPDIDSRGHLDTLSTSSCSSDEFYVEAEDDCFLFEAELAPVNVGLESEMSAVANDSIPTKDDGTWSEASSPMLLDGDENDWSPFSIPEGSQAFTCTTLPLKSVRSQSRPPCRKWSQLSKTEKLKKVEELSLVVSSELGLREQMEIIRIINPTADVSCSDAEFVIDLKDLTDSKLESIEDIVNFHCSQTNEPHFHKSNRNTDRKFSKKNKSQDRHPCSKVSRRRIQKEHKQRLKEQRSGLFVKEERLAVSTSVMEEEIDVLE